MSLLALDISTKTGWCIFKEDVPFEFGLLSREFSWNELEYPRNFVLVSGEMANKMMELIKAHPEVTDIVIEETNKTGRFGSRHSQKILEFIHGELNRRLYIERPDLHVWYINTSDWRRTLKLSVAETKKAAKPFLKKLSEMKKALEKEQDRKKKALLKGEIQEFTKQLKKKCIHGKIDKKSISVAYVNATFGLDFKKGDNDISDAICLGRAMLAGAPHLTNKDIFENGDTDEAKPTAGVRVLQDVQPLE